MSMGMDKLLTYLRQRNPKKMRERSEPAYRASCYAGGQGPTPAAIYKTTPLQRDRTTIRERTLLPSLLPPFVTLQSQGRWLHISTCFAKDAPVRGRQRRAHVASGGNTCSDTDSTELTGHVLYMPQVATFPPTAGRCLVLSLAGCT